LNVFSSKSIWRAIFAPHSFLAPVEHITNISCVKGKVASLPAATPPPLTLHDIFVILCPRRETHLGSKK
jgi:hypothetical protein